MPIYWESVYSLQEAKSKFDKYENEIRLLLAGEYKSANLDLKKKKDYKLYTIRLNLSDRLLFTTIVANGKSHVMLLEVIENHDYQRSKYLNHPELLKKFLEPHAALAAIEQGVLSEFILDGFEELPELNFENEPLHQESAAASSSSSSTYNTFQYQAATYYNDNFIFLSDEQKLVEANFPLIVSGPAGSGKSCVAISLLKKQLLKKQLDDDNKPILYITKSDALVNYMKSQWCQLPEAYDDQGNLHDHVCFMTYEEMLAKNVDASFCNGCDLYLMSTPNKFELSNKTHLYLYKDTDNKDKDKKFFYQIEDKIFYLKDGDVPKKLKTMKFNNTKCDDNEICIPILNSTSNQGHTLCNEPSSSSSIDRLISGVKFVDFANFQAWSKGKVKDKIKSISLPLEKIYEELRICSDLENDKQYINIGKKNSTITPEEIEIKKQIFKIFEQYKHYLEISRIINADFFELNKSNIFQSIIVDEAQDFSPLQLSTLFGLAAENQVAYCLDIKQSLSANTSIRPYLMRFCTNNRYYVLPSSYRCGKNILAVAKTINDIKNSLAGGTADKLEAAESEIRSNKINLPDNVYWAESSDAVKEMISSFKESDIAVVALPKHLEEAKQEFKTPHVFTPEQIKGLEYKIIIAFKPLDDEIFEKANAKILAEGIAKVTGQATEHSHSDYRPAFSQLFTTITRATDCLIFLHKKSHKTNRLFAELEGLFQEHQSSAKKTSQPISSKADWEESVLRLLGAKQYDQAKKVYVDKLQKTEAEADKLINQFKTPLETPKAKINIAPAVEAAAAASKAIIQSLSQRSVEAESKEGPGFEKIKVIKKSSPQKPASAAAAESTEKNKSKKKFDAEECKKLLRKNPTNINFTMVLGLKNSQNIFDVFFGIQGSEKSLFADMISSSTESIPEALIKAFLNTDIASQYPEKFDENAKNIANSICSNRPMDKAMREPLFSLLVILFQKWLARPAFIKHLDANNLSKRFILNLTESEKDCEDIKNIFENNLSVFHSFIEGNFDLFSMLMDNKSYKLFYKMMLENVSLLFKCENGRSAFMILSQKENNAGQTTLKYFLEGNAKGFVNGLSEHISNFPEAAISLLQLKNPMLVLNILFKPRPNNCSLFVALLSNSRVAHAFINKFEVFVNDLPKQYLQPFIDRVADVIPDRTEVSSSHVSALYLLINHPVGLRLLNQSWFTDIVHLLKNTLQVTSGAATRMGLITPYQMLTRSSDGIQLFDTLITYNPTIGKTIPPHEMFRCFIFEGGQTSPLVSLFSAALQYEESAAYRILMHLLDNDDFVFSLTKWDLLFIADLFVLIREEPTSHFFQKLFTKNPALKEEIQHAIQEKQKLTEVMTPCFSPEIQNSSEVIFTKNADSEIIVTVGASSLNITTCFKAAPLLRIFEWLFEKNTLFNFSLTAVLFEQNNIPTIIDLLFNVTTSSGYCLFIEILKVEYCSHLLFMWINSKKNILSEISKNDALPMALQQLVSENHFLAISDTGCYLLIQLLRNNNQLANAFDFRHFINAENNNSSDAPPPFYQIIMRDSRICLMANVLTIKPEFKDYLSIDYLKTTYNSKQTSLFSILESSYLGALFLKGVYGYESVLQQPGISTPSSGQVGLFAKKLIPEVKNNVALAAPALNLNSAVKITLNEKMVRI